MSNLIDGNKLLVKIRKRKTDTNEVIDYFDVADFELSWIEKYIVKEMQANGVDKSTEQALPIRDVSNLLLAFALYLDESALNGGCQTYRQEIKNFLASYNC